MNITNSSIPPRDLALLQSVLNAWCFAHRIDRRLADRQAKILIEEYARGSRSQLDLIDALEKAPMQ
ncbi:hypothetical protein [Pararhizobium sp.]|uniref:hypothetical protein n=1 Tax=Pararhizobium sp. TaxID=1977563 RepID=UPI0027270650|nr:hypothetical protein [Pararhizobium sp.]MDO9415852.1 hypothetical protein [Pararhizobium sp.]